MPVFGGYPYQLHADEPTIVNNAIDIIARKSYLPNVFNRPDHFEIKCCAILFQIFSYMFYGKSASIVFSSHVPTFYVIARMFTAFFGVIMVLLSYLITKRINKKVGLLCALLTCCYPTFIIHSAYATPDIVLTAFIMFVAYLSIRFFEENDYKFIYLSCCVIGVGITVKYTCAICCLWVAILVIQDSIKNRKLINIVSKGLICIAIVILSCFVVAPNLFTDWKNTLSTLAIENRSTHIGADGLNPIENIVFYVKQFVINGGIETIPLTALGILLCFQRKKPVNQCIIIGAIYLICISMLSLHWDRWGMPAYAFLIILESMGICYIDEKIKKKCITNILITILVILQVSSAVIETYKTRIPDTRTIAYEYCLENNINAENAIFDGYTPLNMNHYKSILDSYDEFFVYSQPDNKFNIIIPDNIKYLIVSSGMYNRYFNESDKYTKEVELYKEFDERFKPIYIIKSNVNFGSFYKTIRIINFIKTISAGEAIYQGPTIKIYKVN